ncbi:MAG: hypothetical protein Q9205_007688 [Flavoplaca limonia]
MVLQQALHRSECKPTFPSTHEKPKCFSLFTTNFRFMAPVLLYMKAEEKLRQSSADMEDDINIQLDGREVSEILKAKPMLQTIQCRNHGVRAKVIEPSYQVQGGNESGMSFA